MKRVFTFVAIVVALPAAVWAQVPPPPPPTPAPPAPVVAVPLPPLPPSTPMPPRAVIAPTIVDPWDIEMAIRASTQAQVQAERAGAEAAREAVRAAQAEARAQAEEWRMAMPMPWPADFHYDYNYNYDYPYGQEGGSYSSGLSQLHQRQYERAVTSFDREIARKGPRTDAALYWKAYSLFKLGRRDDAIATIAQLRKEYP